MYVGRTHLRNSDSTEHTGHVRTVLFAICMWDVCSNIVIGLSVLDHMVQCCLLCMWDVSF